MTMNPVDPNAVRLTGENSFIRLAEKEGGQDMTRASHWRILRSPGGPGHVLFLRSELTHNEVRIYSDNAALTRWLQEEIESALFPAFSDQNVPIIEAEFARLGNHMTFSTESVESQNDSVSLTWYKLGAPFIIRFQPGGIPGSPHGVYSCLTPAGAAQVSINGVAAKGRCFPEKMADHMSSTSCLAWGETWVRPG